MGAGIEKSDRGYVWGETWHKLPQYVRLDRPVTLEEAREVFDYPLEKRRLFVRLPGSHRKAFPVDAWAICRMDTNTVVAPSVGSLFHLYPNLHLLDFVANNVLSQFDDLEIESVGTLRGGGIAFVNLCLERFHVRHDESETLSRLMYYNPISYGSYRVCAHDIRVVCQNTLRMAEAEGAANRTLMKIRHTPSAAERIAENLVDLAQVKLAAKEHREVLDTMADRQVVEADVSAFLGEVFPVNEKGELTVQMKANRDRVRGFFERKDPSLGKANGTAYGLLNAYTYWTDNDRPVTSRTDITARAWDSVTGSASVDKKKAYSFLKAL